MNTKKQSSSPSLAGKYTVSGNYTFPPENVNLTYSGTVMISEDPSGNYTANWTESQSGATYKFSGNALPPNNGKITFKYTQFAEDQTILDQGTISYTINGSILMGPWKGKSCGGSETLTKTD